MGNSHRISAAVARVRSPRVRARQPVELGLRPGPVRMATQPILDISSGHVIAHEALARFGTGATQDVFNAAYASGYGLALESVCLRAALRLRDDLPEGTLLTVNVSPNALSYLADDAVWPGDLRGVVVEITEQDADTPVDADAQLRELRERGAAVAVDDVSTGYAGLLRLARMRPDYVKVDRQVVSGVGDDTAQAAVLEALVALSHRLGAAVIAEGVEDLRDIDALAQLDVDYVQGFALARPVFGFAAVGEDVVSACRASRRRVVAGQAVGDHAASRTRDVYAVTAALADASRRRDLDVALAAAARDLDVDAIGVSVLTSGMNLREIASTTAQVDPAVYALSDFPATLAVVRDGTAVEVQGDDPEGDAAERRLLLANGRQSLLLLALRDENDATIGILELTQSTARRWSPQDLAHAHGLAVLLAPVLRRIGVGSLAATTGRA